LCGEVSDNGLQALASLTAASAREGAQ
jgi:hypothetical protein